MLVNDFVGKDKEPAQPSPAPQQNKKSDTQSFFKQKKFLQIVLALVIVLSIGSAFYFYNQYQEIKKNPTQAQQAKNASDTERVLSQLSNIILIDSADKPTVARIENVEILKKTNQEFYKNIAQGDYLIIYPKRAIIFRESTGQIINIAPIINTAELQQKQQDQKQQTTKKTNSNN